MSLSDIELRILGSLVEKERTTPDQYPLSTNALILACNQKTNRDPVMDYAQRDVEEALRSLRDKGLAATVRADHERVFKHQHRLEEAFRIGPREFALLAVLMLRGPQTPGELRSRTERYVHFADPAAVEASLQRLSEHQPPLARNHGRGPGQSQDRWDHTLGVDPERLRPRVRPLGAAGNAMSGTAAGGAASGGDLEALWAEVRELREQLERVLSHLGLGSEEQES